MACSMIRIRSMLHHIRYLLHNRRSNTYSNTVCRRQARQRRRESRSVRTLQLRFPGSVAGFWRCAQSPGLRCGAYRLRRRRRVGIERVERRSRRSRGSPGIKKSPRGVRGGGRCLVYAVALSSVGLPVAAFRASAAALAFSALAFSHASRSKKSSCEQLYLTFQEIHT